MFKMYKVLINKNGKLISPFQKYEYEVGKKYIVEDFDDNNNLDCSRGYYATEIEGLIYSFRNLSGYCVYECEVSGRKVEIDQFKRRYERLKLVREVPLEEIRLLALAEEEKVGYKLSEALFPIHPFKIKADPVTEKEIELLKKWASVWDSVWASIKDSVWASVWASVGAYISSLFPGIKKWKLSDHPEDENPFQSCIDLWHKGFVPNFDGKVWRLYAGEKAEVVWEGDFPL